MRPLLCKPDLAMYMIGLLRKSCLTKTKLFDYETRLCHSPRPPVDAISISYPAETINGNKYSANHKTKQMTFSTMNNILKSNEYSFKVNGHDGRNSISHFDSNILSSNTPSEDRRSAATCLQSKAMLFGVFDGHAGFACAQAVSERLFYYIAVSLLPVKTLVEIEDAVENERPVLPLLQWHKHPNDHTSTDSGRLYFHSLRTYWQERIDLEEDENEDRDVKAALIKAFKRLDNDISLEAQVEFGESMSHSTPLRVALSGCTACVVHVDGNDLYVANLGDSRAVLGVQEENGTWSAHTMTNDHNAQNADELQRVLREHPALERKTVVKHDRLLGLLVPFRGFGDMGFKWSAEMLNRVYETRPDILSANEFAKRLPPNYHTPPYLVAEPEVTRHSLQPKDKFLILATDGLWELMHRQIVVQVIGEHLMCQHWKKPVSGLSFTLGQMLRLLQERKSRAISDLEEENCATHLIRFALGSDDFGTVDPRRLSNMLSLPPDRARMYRDDITIVVIHFHSANT